MGARWCTPLVMERTAAWCAALAPRALRSKRRLQGSQSAPARRQRPWLGLLLGKFVPGLFARRPFIKNSSDLSESDDADHSGHSLFFFRRLPEPNPPFRSCGPLPHFRCFGSWTSIKSKKTRHLESARRDIPRMRIVEK